MKTLLSIIASLLITTAAAQRRIRVMEWNVENLFDVQHDSQKQDYEFLPDGDKHWTARRYWRKLNDVARTIMAVGNATPPDIVALCEVENDSVMRSLTRSSALRDLGYKYVITSSPDARGIDCALLYQPLHFGLLSWHAIRVPSVQQGFNPTRDILYAKGTVGRGDTLHVIVCHLPSRRGGAKGDRHRALAMQTLQHVVDSLRGKRVIVTGDFNDAQPQINTLRRNSLQLHPKDKVRGTYLYKNKWSQLDHLFTSPRLRVEALHVATFSFLLEHDKKNKGMQPRRTYKGPNYHNGISDHLPIWADIILR